GVIGATALFVATATHSLALAGFALNALLDSAASALLFWRFRREARDPAPAGFARNPLLDSAASAILVWRFRRERRDPHAAERLERRAQALIAVAMLVIALYVGLEAVRALMNASHADESLLGVVLAVVSL